MHTLSTLYPHQIHTLFTPYAQVGKLAGELMDEQTLEVDKITSSDDDDEAMHTRFTPIYTRFTPNTYPIHTSHPMYSQVGKFAGELMDEHTVEVDEISSSSSTADSIRTRFTPHAHPIHTIFTLYSHQIHPPGRKAGGRTDGRANARGG